MKRKREKIDYERAESEARVQDVNRNEANIEDLKVSGIVKRILFS